MSSSKLALGDFPSIVTLDVTAARERIESLPWVSEVTLRKVYPDTLQIEIKERKPYRRLAARRRVSR